MSLEKELNNTLATVLRNIQAETIQAFIQEQTSGSVAALPVAACTINSSPDHTVYRS